MDCSSSASASAHLRAASGYRHFIITLFNLRLWPRDKQGEQTQTEAWTQQRADLFERYCLPSLRQQTVGDFTWLVLFDRHSPAALLRRIEDWQQQVPQLQPLFFGEEAAELLSKDDTKRALFLRQTIDRLLAADADQPCRWLLTTNVDNDDAVHRQMVERLQQAFEREHPEEAHLFCFPAGWQWFEQGQVLLRMRYPHNHFLTLCEPVEEGYLPLTIKYFKHTKARKLLPVTDLKGDPMWMEVVHGRNVSNGLRLSARISYHCPWRSLQLDDFGLPLTLSWRHNLWNALTRVPGLFCQTAIEKIKDKR